MKRGAKPLTLDVTMLCWLLVELQRDKEGSTERNNNIELACKRVSDRFASNAWNGKVLPLETIKRHYHDARKLLNGAPDGMQKASAVLAELRRVRDAVGWKTQPLALLGFSNEDMAHLFTTRDERKLPKLMSEIMDLDAARLRLAKLQAENAIVDQHIDRLEAERHEVLTQLAGLGCGKPN